MVDQERRADARCMRRWALAVLLLLALVPGYVPLEGQALRANLSGVVLDELGDPVPRAEVYIVAAGRRTVSDELGRFTLRSVPAGRHVVQAALLGYAPVRRELAVGEANDSLTITLARTPLSIPGVQVTGTVGGNDPLALTQATSQLAGKELERAMGATLSETLRLQPGVAVRSMGPAASMPVMRGLTGDRILVLQDGQRTGDLSGSADDHGVTIDPLTAQRVELVRGPATLMYGNNAIGGVVNVISGDIPSYVPLRAEWLMSGQTESAYPGASVSFKTTQPLSSRLVVTARGGGRSTESMRIPSDPVLGSRLANTQMRNLSGSAGVGYATEAVTAGAALKAYDFAYGIPVPPGADPVSLSGRRYEASGRGELSLRSGIVPTVRVEATGQDYTHDELDERSGDVLQTFALRTEVVNVLARQGRWGPLSEGAWGVSGLFKDYVATGPAALTPPAWSRGVGAFLFEEVALRPGGAALQVGGRFDDYRVASRDAEKFGPGRERSFQALSGSVGLRIPLPPALSVSASVARSFRAPTVEELFSNAAHAGTGAVELGNPELEAERGLAAEGLLRVQNSRWNGQFAVYRNRIDDYVYLAERGDTTLYGVTLPILSYAQDRAVLWGTEGSLEWAATPKLVLGAMGDQVHGVQADGTPLSFMPPPRIGSSARWDDGTYSLAADVHHELRQARVGAAGELPTPEHTILRMNAGVRFRVAGFVHSVTLRAENLGDETHREATSRIKDFAPGPGRNIALLYRLLF
ncbi:MAG: TonB-dependent receptor [Gemmatimonadetes bacterium]|nr:TonB-dependent receptor [Gemmatimonadota bacterium]